MLGREPPSSASLPCSPRTSLSPPSFAPLLRLPTRARRARSPSSSSWHRVQHARHHFLRLRHLRCKPCRWTFGCIPCIHPVPHDGLRLKFFSPRYRYSSALFLCSLRHCANVFLAHVLGRPCHTPSSLQYPPLNPSQCHTSLGTGFQVRVLAFLSAGSSSPLATSFPSRPPATILRVTPTRLQR